ncbi:MAG: hypothetical protein V1773_17995 [bacterium]
METTRMLTIVVKNKVKIKIIETGGFCIINNDRRKFVNEQLFYGFINHYLKCIKYEKKVDEAKLEALERFDMEFLMEGISDFQSIIESDNFLDFFKYRSVKVA